MDRKTVKLGAAQAPNGMRIYAIGDVHGRLDLLTRLYEEIQAEIAGDAPPDWRIVFLGDYVDRGPNSSGVIDFLMDAIARDSRHTAIVGNHDVAFLDFLSAPEMESLFVHFGGVETASSYGVILDTCGWEGLRASHAALVAAVPAEQRSFLERLPFAASYGDYFFCHAGVRPGIDLAAQSTDDLAWIRNDFLRSTRLFEKIIVHGHTPVEHVQQKANRINVDTGAYFRGRLSAVALEGNTVRVIEAEDEDGFSAQR